MWEQVRQELSQSGELVVRIMGQHEEDRLLYKQSAGGLIKLCCERRVSVINIRIPKMSRQMVMFMMDGARERAPEVKSQLS